MNQQKADALKEKIFESKALEKTELGYSYIYTADLIKILNSFVNEGVTDAREPSAEDRSKRRIGIAKKSVKKYNNTFALPKFERVALDKYVNWLNKEGKK